MAYLALLPILLSMWLAFMLPKGAMNRTVWANPKKRAITFLLIACIAGVIISILGKSYTLAAIAVIAPALAYMFSENKEVSRLVKLDKSDDSSGSNQVYRGIVRRRD